MLIGCRTQKVSSDCLTKLKWDIKNNWKLNSEGTYHLYNDSFTLKIDTAYKKCLTGLNSESVLQLFGEPDEFKELVMKYYFSPPCIYRNNGCEYMYFEFSKDTLVKRYGVIFMTAGTSY